MPSESTIFLLSDNMPLLCINGIIYHSVYISVSMHISKCILLQEERKHPFLGQNWEIDFVQASKA